MPKANIEGTHKPMKVPSSLNPWKYKISEKIKDNEAAKNKSLSEVVNLLNIFSFKILSNIKKTIQEDPFLIRLYKNSYSLQFFYLTKNADDKQPSVPLVAGYSRQVALNHPTK